MSRGAGYCSNSMWFEARWAPRTRHNAPDAKLSPPATAAATCSHQLLLWRQGPSLRLRFSASTIARFYQLGERGKQTAEAASSSSRGIPLSPDAHRLTHGRGSYNTSV